MSGCWNVRLIVFVWLTLVGVSFGKQVYLKEDGAILECESFWRRGDQVIVKVNRDVVLEFDKSEVDLKRTFIIGKKKAYRTKRSESASAIPSTTSAAPTVEAAIVAAPVASPARPAPAPTPPPLAKLKPASNPPPAANPASAPNPPPAATSAPTVTVTPPAPTPAPQQPVQPVPAQPASVDTSPSPGAQADQSSDAPQPNIKVPQFGGAFLVGLMVGILFMIVSLWIVFTKAGRSGIGCIIPIYNTYVLLQIAGKPGWWLLLMFIPIVSLIVYLMTMISLAQAFGKGVGFGIGLFFLPMFFFPALAFGGAQYEG